MVHNKSELVKAIERILPGRLDKFGDPNAFGQTGPTCEMQVRYSLIDPILRAIGWDLENPDCVRVELNPGDSTRKRRDYTLFVTGKPVAIVESKCWGHLHTAYGQERNEDIKGFMQLRAYCRGHKIKIGALSDGGCWVIFELHDNLKVKSKDYIDFDSDKIGLDYDTNITKMIKAFMKLSPKNVSKQYEK